MGKSSVLPSFSLSLPVRMEEAEITSAFLSAFLCRPGMLLSARCKVGLSMRCLPPAAPCPRCALLVLTCVLFCFFLFLLRRP